MDQHPMDPSEEVATTIARRRIAISAPLVDVHVYRPGPLLALAVLAAPAAIALVGAAIAFNTIGRVPVWLPAVFVLWLPGLAILWLALTNVRLSANGIAVGRPWMRWREVTWTSIQRVDKSGLVVRVFADERRRLRFAPILLREGRRLERQLLLRLPLHVLTGALRREADHIVMGDVFPMPAGGLSGSVRSHPRGRWQFAALVLVALASAGSGTALALLPTPMGALVAALALLLAVVAFGVLVWLLQTVTVSESGVAVRAFPFGPTRAMRWKDIQMIETTPHQALLRFRGEHRLLCPGPSLLGPAERDVMLAFIHRHCDDNHVPIVQRRWLN